MWTLFGDYHAKNGKLTEIFVRMWICYVCLLPMNKQNKLMELLASIAFFSSLPSLWIITPHFTDIYENETRTTIQVVTNCSYPFKQNANESVSRQQRLWYHQFYCHTFKIMPLIMHLIMLFWVFAAYLPDRLQQVVISWEKFDHIIKTFFNKCFLYADDIKIISSMNNKTQLEKLI